MSTKCVQTLPIFLVSLVIAIPIHTKQKIKMTRAIGRNIETIRYPANIVKYNFVANELIFIKWINYKNMY